MKVLVLTITAGYGHHATAKAISDELIANGAEVRVLDLYKYLNKLLYEGVSRGYLTVTKYTPALFRVFYETFEKKGLSPDHFNVNRLVNSIFALKFTGYLQSFDPDFIVCSHIFCAQLVNAMKAKGKINVPCLGVVTDYAIHPFWEDVPKVEYIVTASELLTYSAISRGIPPEHILPLGIPVAPKFSIKRTKEEAKAMLGLIPDRPVALVMGGSMGFGDIEQNVENVCRSLQNYQVIAVCGNNKRAYNRLVQLKESLPNLIPYGFVDMVDIFMDAAEFIITKPGGLTITEALAKNLPIILTDPIPGHEERNTQFLQNNGIAICVTKNLKIDEAVYYLTKNPVRLRLMREGITAISRPEATRNICTFILQHKKETFRD